MKENPTKKVSRQDLPAELQTPGTPILYRRFSLQRYDHHVVVRKDTLNRNTSSAYVRLDIAGNITEIQINYRQFGEWHSDRTLYPQHPAAFDADMLHEVCQVLAVYNGEDF